MMLSSSQLARLRRVPELHEIAIHHSRNTGLYGFHKTHEHKVIECKSPEYKSKAPYKPNQATKTLQEIPATYEFVYLSGRDEELVCDLTNLIADASCVDPREAELFDMISIDFGPQVFLQSFSLFDVSIS